MDDVPLEMNADEPLTHPIPSERKKNTWVIIGIILVVGLATVSLAHLTVSKQERGNIASVSPSPTITQVEKDTLYYQVYHVGTVSGYQLSQNHDLQSDDYSEVYALNEETTQKTFLFTDKYESFTLPDVIESIPGAVLIHNRIYYRAVDRKWHAVTDPSNYAINYYDLGTHKIVHDTSLPYGSVMTGSEDGRWVVYNADPLVIASNTQIGHIFMKDMKSGTSRELIALNPPESLNKPSTEVIQSAMSADGKYLALATSNAASQFDDWTELLVINTQTGETKKIIQKSDELTIGGYLLKWVGNDKILYIGYPRQESPSVTGFRLYSIDISNTQSKILYTFPPLASTSNFYQSIIDMQVDKDGENIFYVEDRELLSGLHQGMKPDMFIKKVNIATQKTEALQEYSNLYIRFIH